MLDLQSLCCVALEHFFHVSFLALGKDRDVLVQVLFCYIMGEEDIIQGDAGWECGSKLPEHCIQQHWQGLEGHLNEQVHSQCNPAAQWSACGTYKQGTSCGCREGTKVVNSFSKIIPHCNLPDSLVSMHSKVSWTLGIRVENKSFLRMGKEERLEGEVFKAYCISVLI